MDPRVVASEGDEVVVLYTTRALAPDGERFESQVLGLYEVRDGKFFAPRCFTTTPPRCWRSSNGRPVPATSRCVRGQRDRARSSHRLVYDRSATRGPDCPDTRRKWGTGDEIASRRAVWKIEVARRFGRAPLDSGCRTDGAPAARWRVRWGGSVSRARRQCAFGIALTRSLRRKATSSCASAGCSSQKSIIDIAAASAVPWDPPSSAAMNAACDR